MLLSIWRLQNNAYGITIRDEMKRVTLKSMSFGALYVSLDKLVKKGYVTKKPGKPTAKRGGRSKNFYTLTTTGLQSLEAAREMNEKLWSNVPALIPR